MLQKHEASFKHAAAKWCALSLLTDEIIPNDALICLTTIEDLDSFDAFNIFSIPEGPLPESLSTQILSEVASVLSVMSSLIL